MNSKSKGNIAEKKAKEYLLNKKFRIVETNFYCKGGEIDIIAYK
ncbi:YraN family protein, partial [Caminibacter mediatlanticus]